MHASNAVVFYRASQFQFQALGPQNSSHVLVYMLQFKKCGACTEVSVQYRSQVFTVQDQLYIYIYIYIYIIVIIANIQCTVQEEKRQ